MDEWDQGEKREKAGLKGSAWAEMRCRQRAGQMGQMGSRFPLFNLHVDALGNDVKQLKPAYA